MDETRTSECDFVELVLALRRLERTKGFPGKEGRVGNVIDYIQRTYKKLESEYNDPLRKYHNLFHIDNLLEHYSRMLDGRIREPEVFKIAIWFHDYVYDPKSGQNEEQSAEEAGRFLEIFCSPKTIITVRELILATRHADENHTWETQCIADLDLTILGENNTVFDNYESGIREEYLPFYGEAQFAEQRKWFLENMLARPAIFQTELFSQAYNSTARQNLERSLAKYKQ